MQSNFYGNMVLRLGEIVRLLNEFEMVVLQEYTGKDPTEAREFMDTQWDEIVASSKPIRDLFKKYLDKIDEADNEI